MAVTPRAGALLTGYQSGTRTTVFTPTSGALQVGDTIIVGIGEAAERTWTVPSGFTKIYPTVRDGPAGNATQIFLWRVTGTIPTSFTFTASANTFAGLSFNAYAGAVAVGPVSRIVGDPTATNSSAAFPELNIPTANGLMLLIAAMTTGVTPVAPVGFTSRNAPARCLFYEGSVGTGLTGNPTVTFSSGQASTAAVSLHLTDTLVAPWNAVAPVVSGNTWSGQTLSVNVGTWMGAVSYTYQWKRDGSNIGGATGTTYGLVNGDISHDITCTVTATNTAGSTAATSNAVEVTFHNTSPPSISGTAGAGNTYTAIAGVYDEAVTSREYHWLSDGTDVHTGSTFTPGEEYGTRVITVQEQVEGPLGTGSATSTTQRLFYAMQIPFNTVGSPWYEPLPEDVPIDAALSSTLQGYLTTRYSQGGVWYGSGGPYGDSWTADVNIVDSSMTRQPFNVVASNGTPFTATKNGGIKEHLAWSWKTKNGGVPTPPAGFKVTGGTDAHLVVYCHDTYEYWGSWLTNLSASPLPTIQHGCYIPDVREFIGYFENLWGGDEGYAPGGSSEYQYLAWGETAAFNIYMGMLTQKEMQDAATNNTSPTHALAVALPGTDHTARFPALRTENRGTAPLPMGGIWTLARDFDVSTLPTTGNANADQFRKWFAEMVQTYGMIVNDTTAGNFNIRFEGVRGALVANSYAPNSYNWGSLFTKTLQSIVTTIPTSNWRVVASSYRPANGPQLPEPVGIDTLRFTDPGGWGFSGASIDAAGRLSITATAVGSVAYPTGGFTYSLKGNRTFVELVQPVGTETTFHARADSGNQNTLQMTVNPAAGTLVANAKYLNSTVGSNTSTTYDPEAHRWLALRASSDGATIYFETSADGEDWDVLRTLTTPGPFFDLDRLAAAFRVVGTTGVATFRNLNTVPAPVSVSPGWVIGVA